MIQTDSYFSGILKRNLTHVLSVATIALFGAIFVIYPGRVFAEITVPLYTVDYKSQVLFGDSIQVGDYKGLENYQADYKGGYLHMSYTSTHGGGGYASYPPFLYIRSGDPSVNPSTVHVYQGLVQNVNMNPGLPSDVYFVDIQFDASGYREVVTRGTSRSPVSDNTVLINDMNSETFVALANNLPLQLAGQNSMSFAPMRLVATPPSNILSFEISTSTRKATLHAYISTNDLGIDIHFNISTIAGDVVYLGEVVHATTTGDFYYTWSYPEMGDQSTTKLNNYVFYSDIVKDSVVLRQISKVVPLAAAVDGYPGYYNFTTDGSEQIQSSYNYLIQTLGTGLSGNLTQVDVQTSNGAYNYYSSRPTVSLYECNDNTYGNLAVNSGCLLVFSAISDNTSAITQGTQSFYIHQGVVLDPTKYYFFTTQGNNQLNAIPVYYGSISDVVDGACYQRYSIGVFPCSGISDVSFYLRGVSKFQTPVVQGYSNVLFLPGMQASRLYKPKGVTCDINCEDQLWESNNKADVEDLYLNSDGTTQNSLIYTRDAISETNTPFYTGLAGQNIYKSFFAMLDGLTDPDLPADRRMARWETYAYDWRQSVGDIVENGTQYEDGQKSLIATLEALVASSTTGKVTVIAHSNGGLLAKALMVKLQQMKDAGTSDLIDKVDNLVLVASPQIGTAAAVPALLHGYNQRILLGYLLDEEHARELGRNMLGGYGLLPSREYLNRVDIALVTFTDNQIASGVTTGFVNAYGSTTDSYSEYKSFLLGNEGRIDPSTYQTKLPIKLSPILFSKAEGIHDSIDAWVPPQTMRVVEVAGWGLDTIASFKYYPKLTGCTGGSVGCVNPYTLDERPIFTVDGDKTVVEPSAHFMNSEKWWINIIRYNSDNFDREHKDILEIDSLNNLIKSVVEKTNIVPDGVLVNTKPVNTSNRLRISIHSPVSLGGYDDLGNFTGKICVETEDFCYVQEAIPSSSYMEFGEGKYINLPEENLQKVVLQGTDIGTFTFEYEKVIPSGESTPSTFVDIPVTTQTKGEVVVDYQTQLPKLMLDVTGDGVTDFTVGPNATFNPVLFLQIMRKTVETLNIPDAYKNNLYARIDGIIKSIQEGKISKAELKVEKFKSSLDKSVAKKGHKKITDPDALILVTMLENLLNSLEK